MASHGALPTDAVFSLIPGNHRTREIILSTQNESVVAAGSSFQNGLLPNRIDISFAPDSPHGLKPSNIGVGVGGHIFVNSPEVARIHCCSFRIDAISGGILLLDDSPAGTCQVYGTSSSPFVQAGRARWASLSPTVNVEFGFGGADDAWYLWTIVWHRQAPVDLRNWKDPSKSSPVHTVVPQLAAVERYAYKGFLCGNDDREVVNALKLSSSQLVAIKRIHIVKFYQAHITAYHFDIVMALEQGTLQKLVDERVFDNVGDLMTATDRLGRPLLYQMLQALKYLASRGVIHHDVKPDNIFFTQLADGSYHYRLGDFGLSTLEDDPPSSAGAPLFKAPEVMFPELDMEHTTKIDVWSLCATIIVAFERWDTTLEKTGTDMEVVREFHGAANLISKEFGWMATFEPEHRASAAEMLNLLFPGVC
ncbi:hypothetical protein ACJ41O_010240 [Fusarium nematophilum]